MSCCSTVFFGTNGWPWRAGWRLGDQASLGASRTGPPLCPEQSGDPWVGWLARLHVCPSPSMPNLCLAPPWAFACRGLSFLKGTEKSIVTAITDLIEDWIQMRSTLQRQLKMLESSEMHAGDKISDSTAGDTIVRVRRCIAELNSLLKEYAISPRR
jgi:hypothetical protein